MNAATKLPMKLLTMCCECGLVWEVPFDGEQINTRALYRQDGWIISIVNRGPEKVVMAFVCKECAPKVYSPEMMAEVHKNFGGG